MRLQSIIKKARNRELKSLSPIDKTDDVIVDYINIALIALYTRFQMKTDEVVLNLKTNKTIYKLDGSDVDVYKDGVLMVYPNIMKIVKAFDEKGEISINKDDDTLSIYTISYDSVQVPFAKTGEHIGLIYTAGPDEVEFVDSGDGTAVDTNVPIPPQMLEAMLHHIGYSAHGSVEGNIEAENTTHLTRFEAACNKLEALGLVPQDNIDMDINRKGFDI